MHTAEPLVPKRISFAFEIATEKPKRHKSPCTDQIPAELIQAGGNILCSEILELNTSSCSREELPQQWKESSIVPIVPMN
jgi:hypothetical protein